MDMMMSNAQGANGELVESLAECLANHIVLALKAHGFHWNVKGPDFQEFHDFFGEYYEDVDGAHDTVAELMLQYGSNAPSHLVEFAKLTSISDESVGSDAMAMLNDLLEANKTMFESLAEVFAAATAVGDQGVCNFIADRLGAHQKWNWKISAFLGMNATPLTANPSAEAGEMEGICPMCGMPMSQCVCGKL